MNYFFCLLPVALPVFFWAAYHWHADRHLPEPPGHLLIAFLLGVVAFYLGILMYESLDLIDQRYDAYWLAVSNLPGLLLYALLVIGPIEELVKMALFLLVVLRFKEFNDPMDGIIYASFIALGFSAVENIYYLDSLSTAEAFARGFAAPVVHIVFASIWGYYTGKAFLLGKGLLTSAFSSLTVAAFLHGVYDFLAIGLPATALPLVALLIAGLWVWRLRLIRNLHLAEKRIR